MARSRFSEELLAARAASLPAIHYPEDLPIAARRAEIATAIAEHQVVVVAGETGSGKTTQIPKICLELGRGIRGMIGHTQPRRLAARTVAERIASELGTELGQTVGYAVRFNDRVGPDTLVKLMTDGILLAELRRDRQLRAYDTVIIDEAHERSLNIDFLLGYLHQLLPRRPDLKVIITSATIETDRFARHFAAGGRPAPVIEVSGRTYPVELRYRPLVPDLEVADPDDPDADAGSRAGRNARPSSRRAPARGRARAPEAEPEPADQISGICDAVEELMAAGRGDILVFLSGEREIRDTADALRGRLGRLTDASSGVPAVEILPLYARLSIAEQHRVFAPHPTRRVVLSTNVAETSLTVPGIRYVVDAGTARISRYSSRRKVQRLPIEAISQASAAQRAGRCGRVADGICIRLYSEEDFASRPAFTDPEILRTSLASVILSMAAIGLGPVEDFGFLDPPDRRAIADGVALLQELGALDATGALTPIGRTLAALPVDPRLGRMIIAADSSGSLREVIVIAAALSIQDPREYPVEAREAARAKHARFADKNSDFASYLNLWTYLREQQQKLSSSKFRKLCTSEYLHYLRVREWQDLVAQLRQAAGAAGLRWSSAPADPHQVHLALLTGLLTNVGVLDPEAERRSRREPVFKEYLGTRGARFAIFPGSALAKSPPRAVMAAELVETSRLWARTVAKIEPEWVEPLAAHLVIRTYSEPRWEAGRGAVVATERVTLHGVPLVTGRRVDYARIDPLLCRELFIRHALVEGDWRTHHKFAAHNQELRAELGELEERARRRDLTIDDDALFTFYNDRVPIEVTSARHFDRWWKTTRRNAPTLLDLDPAQLRSVAAAAVDPGDFPPTWRAAGTELELDYRFEPGTDSDGVTVAVPLAVLNQLRPEDFSWGVPGLRSELVTALIRSLPKAIRRSFSPAPTWAQTVLPHLDPTRGTSITAALERELEALAGGAEPDWEWDWDRIPSHLRFSFTVIDGEARPLRTGKDLAALQAALAPQLAAAISAEAAALEQTGLRTWPQLDGGAIPRRFDTVRAGTPVTGYPALVAESGGVALRVLPDPHLAERAMAAGTVALLLARTSVPTKAVLAKLSNTAKLALAGAPHADGRALFADCAAACVDAIVASRGGPAWDAAGFDALDAAVRRELPARMSEVISDVVAILTQAQGVDATLNRSAGTPAVLDMRAQYAGLIHPGFIAEAGADRLRHLTRYVRGIARRLDLLGKDPVRDSARTATVTQLRREYADFVAALPEHRRTDADVVEIRWMLEELRISLFAQSLGTPAPISEKRILKAMDTAEAPLLLGQ
ncbi:MAG: ATP-dependent RNA helicase HrpA [Sporichthyaceae bacterium]